MNEHVSCGICFDGVIKTTNPSGEGITDTACSICGMKVCDNCSWYWPTQEGFIKRVCNFCMDHYRLEPQRFTATQLVMLQQFHRSNASQFLCQECKNLYSVTDDFHRFTSCQKCEKLFCPQCATGVISQKHCQSCLEEIASKADSLLTKEKIQPTQQSKNSASESRSSQPRPSEDEGNVPPGYYQKSTPPTSKTKESSFFDGAVALFQKGQEDLVSMVTGCCPFCNQPVRKVTFAGRTFPHMFPCTLCGTTICNSCRENRITEQKNVFCCEKCFVDPRRVLIKKFPFAAWFEGSEKLDVPTGVNLLSGIKKNVWNLLR
jgi:hypothetical protein